jgi:arginase family enzyme
MSHLDLFVSQSNVFSGIQTEFEKAKYVVFGVPFDVTSTYRTGARFGPTAIRQYRNLQFPQRNGHGKHQAA